MNETLKGVAHVGAELAAVKAEVQRLNGLLNDPDYPPKYSRRLIAELKDEVQQQREAHRKTWRQLEQVTGLLRRWMGDEAQDNPHAIYVASEAALSQQTEPVEPAPAQDELLPCPFCGGEPNLTHGDYVRDDLSPMPVVECKSCSAWVRVEDWNRRATRPAQTEQQPEQSGLVAVAEINREYIGDLRLIKRTALESMPDGTKLYAALPAAPSPATAPSHE